MAQDKKRKATDKAKAATPAKRAKVPTPKAKAAAKKPEPKKTTAPKVTSTKAKKVEPKKTPAKTPAKPAKKTLAKAPAKSTPAKGKTPAKTPAKAPVKTPAKEVKKPVKAKEPEKKPEPKAKKTEEKAKPKPAVASVTRAKLDKAKALKVSAAKSKLKAAKALPKSKPAVKKPVRPKKEKDEEEKEEKKKPKPAPKAKETKSAAADKKRKAEEPAESPDVSGRKRRMITPNKKFADFEVDVPAKRVITPNKKYADYETDTTKPGGKVSELRAFIQDKKTGKAETPKAEKAKAKATLSSSKATPSTSKAAKESEDDDSEEKIRIIKPSEMKPAEKLLKKLQKKLEKEAKGSPAPTPTESREKAKIKITKVVDYNKPLSSDDMQMKKLAKKMDTKAKTPAKGKQAPKTPIIRTDVTKSDKPKATPKATPKVAKTTPKSTPEKVIKPKKIKEFKREERPIQAKYMFQKTIQLKNDNQKNAKDESQKVQCWITGIGVFPSGEIIMVDMSNRKIKLFSKDFDSLSQIQLDTIPQDISVSPVNASCAYFTKPFSMEGIQKVVMADGKLTLKEYFVTNGTNRGITCTKAGILTSVQDGRYHDVDINHFKIYLLDYTGNILQSVSTDPSGSRLFKLPLYFTVNSAGNQMIVADCIKQTSYIVSVDMTGKIKFKYEGMNGNGITPRGLTIDDEDNVYVTEWERNNIYILSPTGKRLQMLFSHQELQQECGASLSKPYQICYYKTESERRLIVSQESCNTVKIFKILTKAEMDAENAAAAAEKAKTDAEKAKMLTEKTPTEGEKPAVAATVPEVKKVTVNGDDPKAAKNEATPIVVSPKKPAVQAKVVTIITKKPSIEKVSVTEAPKPAITKVELVSPTKQVIQKIDIPSPTKAVVAPRAVASTSSVPQATVLQVTAEAVKPAQVAKEEILVATPTTPVSEAAPVEPVVSEPDQTEKSDIFADTANDFDDDADESEMNGKLQDIVNAFPEEAETEAAAPVTVATVTVPLTEEPPQGVEEEAIPAAPEVVEQPMEEVQQEEYVEQVIVQPPELTSEQVQVVEVMPDNVMVVQDSLIPDTNVQISETIIDPTSQAAAGFSNFENVVYENVPQVEGEIAMDDTQVVVTSQSLPEGTVTSEAAEYQTVESEIPIELETITTEYCV